MATGLASELLLDQSPEVSHSPTSIPLPDSPPPQGKGEKSQNHVLFNKTDTGSSLPSRGKKKSKKPRVIEEYDPSQPLTSSDEEEHSIQLIEGEGNKNESEVSGSAPLSLPKASLNTTIQRHSDISHVEGTNGSASGSSASQSDEKRRPVIHFSIPTRHKLLPISSLIKRQKGKIRDATGQGIDSTKADKLDDDDDEDYEETPKISLVQEIFGDDDDDEEDVESKTDNQPATLAAHLPNESQKEKETENVVGEEDKNLIEGGSGRWKIVANELPVPTEESETVAESNNASDMDGISELPEASGSGKECPDANEDGEDEPEIIEIVTINVPQMNRYRNIRRRQFMTRFGFDNGGEPELIEIDKDEEDDIQPKSAEEPVQLAICEGNLVTRKDTVKSPVIPVVPEKESERREISRSRSKSRDDERPQFRRPHSSSSMSNCEEGEIVDQVLSKKRKKDKKRVKKKRKRSKDSQTPPPKQEKKVDGRGKEENSDKEEGRSAISWRKPSKRTQNRNYRDGKPKADDIFFREKAPEEKPRSLSPLSKRARALKEKSPARDKSRRDRLDLQSKRSLSKSPVARNGSYRGGRRSRRSRSNSSSPERSLSRRRYNRRRYRRSNSRNHGDSRSPSYITELIRSRSSKHKLSDKSRSRSKERHRNRHRKGSLSRSRSQSPAIHRKRKTDSVERQQKRKALREKEKALIEEQSAEAKERRKERERLKEKEKRKKKEKPQEEDKTEQKEKEKVKEKEKKKKRKRREKSPTPVKAIVADGDSIVVSLSFSKGKSSNAQSRASVEPQKDYQTSAAPAVVEKANQSQSDPELRNTSTEEFLNNSKTDEESLTPPLPNETEAKSKSEEKEVEAIKVTSSGGAENRTPFEEESCSSAAADSTKVIHSQQQEQYEGFSHSSMSPVDGENVQGDSMVTSTGENNEIQSGGDEEKNSSNTPSKSSESSKIFTNLLSKNSSSPRGASAIPESSHGTATTPVQAQPSTVRPLIGNIPGLYASSAINGGGGATPVPPPIVIPTPPPPQGIRLGGVNTSMLNPNVLASVASALLAVRQNQPGKATGSDNMQLRHMNVLGPKSQNFTIQSSLRNSAGGSYQETGGESPMSPNSSEGDDLFEPPTDRPQGDKGTNGSGNQRKSNQLFGGPSANQTSTDGFGQGHSAKEGSLFDTLFGGGGSEGKKAVQKEKVAKPKPKQRNKASSHSLFPGAKKETIKVSTSGGLQKGELRLTDEVPTSAVELIVKQKYLKKLNRQERVVEEVKLSLKPHYSKRHINKDEYKEILRRAVPKICHNKTGEINPGKIKELVEAYVKKFRHGRKRGLDISSIK